MVSTGGAAVRFSSEMKSRAPQLFPSRSSQWTFVSQFSHVDDGHQSSQIEESSRYIYITMVITRQQIWQDSTLGNNDDENDQLTIIREQESSRQSLPVMDFFAEPQKQV